MIGHASQAPNPGDYFTGSVADINYVIVRGDDGQLRAFHNVSHHASSGVINHLLNIAGACRDRQSSCMQWTSTLVRTRYEAQNALWG